MKKIVVKLCLVDEKDKQKAMEAVSSIKGINSLSIESEKLTVVGEVDPVRVMVKLRKKWMVQLDSVGNEEKKDEGKDKAKDGGKEKEPKEQGTKPVDPCNPGMIQYYAVHSMEENPNFCTIC